MPLTVLDFAGILGARRLLAERRKMKQLEKAEILCVGTELLLGDIVNTNAAFLSRRLAALGIGVFWQGVVGDNPGRLAEELRAALSRADLVVLSAPKYEFLVYHTAKNLVCEVIKNGKTVYQKGKV